MSWLGNAVQGVLMFLGAVYVITLLHILQILEAIGAGALAMFAGGAG